MEGSKRDMGSSELTNCTARLMLAKAGRRKLGGTREAKNTNITVVSVYAPTAKAPPRVKWKFSVNLQDVLDRIPQADVLIMLRDFNARVGRCDLESDLWAGVLGRHNIYFSAVVAD